MARGWFNSSKLYISFHECEAPSHHDNMKTVNKILHALQEFYNENA